MQVKIDMTEYQVELLPPDLDEKRIYSRKFPISLTSKMEDKAMPLSSVFSDGAPLSTVILFARTGREKEEWFKRYVPTWLTSCISDTVIAISVFPCLANYML